MSIVDRVSDTCVSRRGFVAGAIGMVAGMGLGGCSGADGGADEKDATSGSRPSDGSAAAAEDSERVAVRVASLKGPTSIGLVKFMDEVAGEPGDGEALRGEYSFEIAGSADELNPKLIKGELDIALVPANVASVLYNKTEGALSVLDVNTLGVLQLVSADENVAGFGQLSGKTVYLTGKGTTPEYVVNFLIAKCGLENVDLQFLSEATEVVGMLSKNPGSTAILPQPFATAACAKVEGLKPIVNLSVVWDEQVDDGSRQVTGVTVVRNEFLKANPAVVSEFVEQQRASVEAVNADPEGSAALVVAAGIIDNENIAAKAIPSCNLVCLTGAEMKDALAGYLQVLYDADPASVGGALPADDFYWEG